MTKSKVINLFPGPGAGKSNTAGALFAELKYQFYRAEYVQEWAKMATWEKRGETVFKSQQYIWGKQSFSIERVAHQVEFTVTDSPLLLSLVYPPDDFRLKSFKQVVLEDYNCYDNLNIYLLRDKPYDPVGRSQDEDGARILDEKIMNMLSAQNIPYFTMKFGRENVKQILEIMKYKGWITDVNNKNQKGSSTTG
jgi:hypothetical protein